MRLRTLILAGSASILAAGLFTACGDGPDPVPTPTTAPATHTPAATTGANPSVSAGTKIGKKAVDLPSNMVTTSTGLKYIDDVVGTGVSPASNSAVVTVHYTGTNAISGIQFDSSVDRKQTVDFPLNQVIAGFSEAISTMKVGGKRTVLIPQALAYRKPYNPSDATSGDLIFEIELIAVK